MGARRYIKLILPLRLEWEPCYWVSEDVVAGQRVLVRFSGRKTVGVVSQTDIDPDIDPARIQPVLECNTGLDPISAQEMELWRFISEYYMCTCGEVYKAAYPPLKTASEQSGARAMQRKEELEARSAELWRKRIARLQSRLDAKNADLGKKHNEAVRIRLEAQRDAIVEELLNAQQRLSLFSRELNLAATPLPDNMPDLKEDALLQQALKSCRPVILKSAARTDSYIAAAAEVLRQGKNVFIMVNEITLAGCLCEQLRDTFGQLLLVHHSQLTRSAQRRICDKVRSGQQYILIGTRSAIFVPHRDLGLIIVENEESTFYKQGDTAPRYNARDCAVKLSAIHKCRIILGSVSPSLETILNGRNGKYCMVDRKADAKEMRPECQEIIVDIPAERAKNGVEGPFSKILLKQISLLPESRRIALIRGFERAEDLPPLPLTDTLTIQQAAHTDLSGYDLVAMLSADALFNASDFRSDEHVFQYLERLRSTCPRLVIQTSQAAHQAFHLKSSETLLEERRAFKLPPYTRMVNVYTSRTAVLSQMLAAKGFSAWCGKDTVHITLSRDKFMGDNKKEIRKTVEDFRICSKQDAVIDVDPA